MEHAADHFASIPLPLGGKLKKIDDHHMEMTVPKMEVFDVWLQPRALTKIT